MAGYRDTGTGAVMEKMILPSLARGGYRVSTQVNIGSRLGGGKHIVDVVAEDARGRHILISLKWQQAAGTAEQKVPFEIMCLTDAVVKSAGLYEKAYLVMGGEGWKLREFYTGGGLHPYLVHADMVMVVTMEGFVTLANRGELLPRNPQPSLFNR